MKILNKKAEIFDVAAKNKYIIYQAK